MDLRLRVLLRMITTRVAACAILAGCAASTAEPSPSPPNPAAQYLSDASYRRSELVASLVNPANSYSQLRLAHYDTGDDADWSLLPEWNPRTEPVAAAELELPDGASARTPLGPGAAAIAIDPAALAGDEAALEALGAQAFFRYPVQIALTAERATASPTAFARYGFWVDETRGAGGLVRAELADGEQAFAYTCATCHAAYRGSALVVGVGNDRLDLGRLAVEAAAIPDPAAAALLMAWGPGRLDVSTTLGTEPVRIADVRPVRWLSHLHADATVALRDRTSLAIRLETLIVTSQDEQVRPPRVVALGLAAYVESLAATLPPEVQITAGEEVFQATCVACHTPPALTGPPVPLNVAGTDPHLGLSANRGTGTYRVPSLHGVATRGPLLHDASLPDLDAMFDPSRTGADYAGGRLGPGPVSGHLFGLDLATADRAALVAYLKTL